MFHFGKKKYPWHNLCYLPPPDKVLREHMFPKQCFHTGKDISATAGEVEKRTYVEYLFAPDFPVILTCLLVSLVIVILIPSNFVISEFIVIFVPSKNFQTVISAYISL